MKNFKTAQWLNNNKDKENLIIFDVRSSEYEKGHIPNAIFISPQKILSGQVKEHGGRTPLPDMKEFVENMNGFGVDDESTVIVYDQGELSMAGRLWWMLRYIGFNEVYVLIDGFGEWELNNYPLSTERPKMRKAKKLTLNLQKNMISDINDVKKAIKSNKQVVIDTRASNRYRGEIEPIDKIPGHIPGTVNFPWTNLSKEHLEDKSRIEEEYNGLGDYDKLIIHCGSGVTATVNILFMEEIGLLPSLYVGSYSDWVSYPENEVVRELE